MTKSTLKLRTTRQVKSMTVSWVASASLAVIIRRLSPADKKRVLAAAKNPRGGSVTVTLDGQRKTISFGPTTEGAERMGITGPFANLFTSQTAILKVAPAIKAKPASRTAKKTARRH